MEVLLLQLLRNQLTDMRSVEQYSITHKDLERHIEYKARIVETETLLNSIERSRGLDF